MSESEDGVSVSETRQNAGRLAKLALAPDGALNCPAGTTFADVTVAFGRASDAKRVQSADAREVRPEGACALTASPRQNNPVSKMASATPPLASIRAAFYDFRKNSAHKSFRAKNRGSSLLGRSQTASKRFVHADIHAITAVLVPKNRHGKALVDVVAQRCSLVLRCRHIGAERK